MDIVRYAERIKEFQSKQLNFELMRYAKHITAIKDAVDVTQIMVTQVDGQIDDNGSMFMASGFAEPLVRVTNQARPSWQEVTFEKCLIWPTCTISPGEQALVVMPPDDVYVVIPAERSKWQQTPLAIFLDERITA